MPSVAPVPPSQRQSNQKRVLVDRTNSSDNAPAESASLPAKTSKRGRRPGQKNFEIYGTLPRCEKFTRQRSPPPPSSAAPATSSDTVAPPSSVAALPIAISVYLPASLVAPSAPASISPLPPAGSRPWDHPASISPLPPAGSRPQDPPRPAPSLPLVRQKRKSTCVGTYIGDSGSALSFAG